MIRRTASVAIAVLIVALVAIKNLVFERERVFSRKEKEIIYRLAGLDRLPLAETEVGGPAFELGKALFFDRRLSGSGAISCATCHNPARSWTDGRRTGMGLGLLRRNTLSLWNVRDNRWFFWDGRTDSAWSQALKPVEAPNEMGGSRLSVFHLIREQRNYSELYEAAFGAIPDVGEASLLPRKGCPCPHDLSLQASWDQVSVPSQEAVNRLFANTGKAIQAFESAIVSNNSRFDRYARQMRRANGGDSDLLTAKEIRGLQLFLRANCVLCHSGPNLTDGEFHNIRLPQRFADEDPGRLFGIRELLNDPFNRNSRFADPSDEDLTRFLVARPQNFGEFKTPSLRNVSLTAPYMHDGRFATLEEVMAYYNTLENAAPESDGAESILTPLFLTEHQISDLIAFLRCLEDARLEFLEE